MLYNTFIGPVFLNPTFIFFDLRRIGALRTVLRPRIPLVGQATRPISRWQPLLTQRRVVAPPVISARTPAKVPGRVQRSWRRSVRKFPNVIAFLDSLTPAQRTPEEWAQVEREFREERDSWDF